MGQVTSRTGAKGWCLLATDQVYPQRTEKPETRLVSGKPGLSPVHGVETKDRVCHISDRPRLSPVHGETRDRACHVSDRSSLSPTQGVETRNRACQ